MTHPTIAALIRLRIGPDRAFGVFHAAGEGQFFPDGREESSGSVVTEDGEHYDYWTGWDDATGTEIFVQWQRIEGCREAGCWQGGDVCQLHHAPRRSETARRSRWTICALRLRSSSLAHSVSAECRSDGSRRMNRATASAMTRVYVTLTPSRYYDTIIVPHRYCGDTNKEAPSTNVPPAREGRSSQELTWLHLGR